MEFRPGKHVWTAVPFLGLTYSVAAYVLFQQSRLSDNLQVLSLGFVCLVPLVVGALIAWLAPARYRGSLKYAVGAPSLVTLLFLLVTAVFMGELWLCVLIAAPIALALAVFGGGLVFFVRHRQSEPDSGSGPTKMMALFLLAAPFLITPLELRTTPPTAVYQVTTQIQIDASPDTVWQYIIRVPEIGAAEQSASLFHAVGVPQPLAADLFAEGVGGLRHGRFAGELLFVETITEWEPNRRIAFAIAPQHTAATSLPLRQVGGPVYDIHSAAYTIEPLATGGVTLHLSGTYSLTSYFNGYGRLWMDLIMGDFQNYVLQVVKQRAEADY